MYLANRYLNPSPGRVVPSPTGSVVTTSAPEVITGPPGLSAYQIAVLNGFSGTQDDWLDSLKGEAGDPAVFPQIDEDGHIQGELVGGKLRLDITNISGRFIGPVTVQGDFTPEDRVILPVYASNAAALSGGLVAGEQYKTSAGDNKTVV